jgi:hypothetical protein
MSAQTGLFEEAFETSKPANALFCHEVFLEKVAAHSRDAIGRRASFLMQRLLVDARRLHYKATAGVNRGWRRSRLGGNHGSHFYAWWAPKSAVPLKEAAGFLDTPDGAIFLRDIRHHDDHSPLDAQAFQAHYLPISVRDVRTEEYAPVPWNVLQARFASARQPVRILKGHPGSGKTTALWNAVDSAGARRALYVTYSRDLAALSHDYFDRFCSAHKRFEVVTFPDLVRQLLDINSPKPPEREARQHFLRDVSPFARSLGAWTTKLEALYDELHAHLIGDALPVEVARFAGCKSPRVPDGAYRQRRARFLGEGPVTSALDAAARLERLDSANLADRYFPELALAWRAAEKLLSGRMGDSAWLDFDCIGVDECQDLTPIEAFWLIELASGLSRQRRNVPLLIAGDEAQTVRPTDFEWAWLNDLLHCRLGTPSEHKLSANLRSPRRITEIVNRVWDLYSYIHKQERPSGSGSAEIEDDAADQVLYCNATPGPDLDVLLTSLATREGLAMITLRDTVPQYVPQPARGAVLTVSEVKGLDFHSVCVLDAGHQIERILRDHGRFRIDLSLDFLNKRLAIDQLRVALSRPSERLIWLDINATDLVIRGSIDFLNGGFSSGGVSSCVAAALLKTLEEDDLDVEERVQSCQTDARQLLEIKPEMAWSRAQQAVALLGHRGSIAAITDEAARNAAHLTLAEIAFTLGIRNAKLSPELGRPDFFGTASRAASDAGRSGLSTVLDLIGRIHRSAAEARLEALVDFARTLPAFKSEAEPWLLLEIHRLTGAWMDTLEAALFNGHNANILLHVLPEFYAALDVVDRETRMQRLRQRAAQLLIKDKQFAAALTALRGLSERQSKLEALCHEGLHDFRAAAECHMAERTLKDALNCYRSIPDLAAATKLAREMSHPAAESLEWIAKLRQIVSERPDKFTKTVSAAEKKTLENLLEQALGVTRRKPAPRKAAAKKAAVRKTAPPRKRAVKKAHPGSGGFDNGW